MTFKDRFDAARKLAPKLNKYKNAPDTVILAIPRGSLEMGYELSGILNLPLDIVVTKKIPAPGNEEYAIGSIGPDGEALLNEDEVKAYGIPDSYLEAIKSKLMEDINRRYATYRKNLTSAHPADKTAVAPEAAKGPANIIPDFAGKTVILIDDGIATGFTMKAAIQYLKRNNIKKLIVAVPVAASDSAQQIKYMVDEFICLSVPFFFAAVGQFYEYFPQVTDEQAADYLEKANKKFGNMQN